MKSITLIILLTFALLTASPSAAGPGSENTTDQPSAWSRLWQDFIDDWRKIGQDAKESGTEAGRTVIEEFQEMPENFRKGFEEAKEDFQNGTSLPGEPHTEN
ncbi:MAG: hypothetical protein HGJ93_16900 [Desulfosarcina sp.]|nr:hypothetical protein [Desulfosarcina sp.]MBC2767563.1 hypothetical protein [Desulfosarcina sp.]